MAKRSNEVYQIIMERKNHPTLANRGLNKYTAVREFKALADQLAGDVPKFIRFDDVMINTDEIACVEMMQMTAAEIDSLEKRK